MIISRILSPTDADATAMLDAMHNLSVLNSREWWACSFPPYPSRGEFDDMLAGKGKFVILTDDQDGRVVGWNYIGPEGEMWAGNTELGPNDGHAPDFDEKTQILQLKLIEATIAETGKVQHMAVKNANMWYALEVQCHIPRHPMYDHLGPAPTEPPPLPPEAVIT